MKNRGYTLLELVLVIVIIAILTGIAVQSVKKTSEAQRLEMTMSEMDMLARAIAGDERLVTGGVRTDFGYVGDIGSLPSTLDALVNNTEGYRTWDGPYISSRFVEDPDGYKTDSWDEPYLYSGGVTITSNGGGSPVTRRIAGSPTELTSNSVYGIVHDRSGCPPADGAANVLVTIVFPDGAGSVTDLSTSPSRSGEFSFRNALPVGSHLIRAVASGSDADTTSRYLSINPGSRTFVELKFASDLWCGSPTGRIEYVENSAYTSPAGDMLGFRIVNKNSESAAILNVMLEYDSSPAAYYETIRWDTVPLRNRPDPRMGSGEAAILASSRTLAYLETADIEIDNWKTCRTGDCSDCDVRGNYFCVTFSNGDTISFTSPQEKK